MTSAPVQDGRGERGTEALWYVAAAAAASLAAAFVLQLWRADLRVPFLYSWDAVSSQAATKGMLENGWFFINPHLGAPATQVVYDYPGSDFFNLLVLRLFGFLSSNSAVVVNLFFLAGFPLVALTTFWAVRKLGLSRVSALFVAVAYAVVPYHFLRGEYHLFLSFYVLIPPSVLLAYWLMRSDERVDMRWGQGGRAVWLQRILVVILCMLIASSGVYYALLAALLFLVGGVVAWVRSRRVRAVLPSVVLIAVIALTMAANFAPTLVYRAQMGPNQSAVQRTRSEAQFYGLRIDGLLLPATQHRIPAFAALQKSYFGWLGDEEGAVWKENASEALGLVGALGFLALLVVLLLRAELAPRESSGPTAVLGDASIFNGVLVLLATTSGLGAVFSFAFPLIRAYNRVSIIIALLALLAAGALIDRFWEPGRRPALRAAVVLGLLVVAILDQSTPAFVPEYQAIAEEYQADAAYVETIEREVPAGANVFQLPYVAFPESAFVHRMVDYDHLRPYLHSDSIHWSYGAVKGRKTSRWQERVAQLPAAEMIKELQAEEFRGVWIDGFGYADGGDAIVQEFADALGTEGIPSASGRYTFFVLP